ncbi:MAG TPA: CapA family protein [Pyrinomonadaceae bacterium]|jgi:poly-gamma-glutamate synthesis protein (capsule biosynthesis protein)
MSTNKISRSHSSSGDAEIKRHREVRASDFKSFRFVVSALFLVALLIFSLTYQKPELIERGAVVEPERITESRVTFLAVGDMMISRGVARSITRANDPLVPFRKMDGIFRSTDFNFGNLEVPISGNNNVLGKGLVFNMHTRDIAGLKAYNFKVLNLANNHALDQGVNGLRRTRQFLDEHGFTHLGVGDDPEQAWQPKTITVNGVKIGFVGASYASVNDGGVARNDYVARIEDTDRLKTAIARLRAEGADFIVATMHAGVEYTRRPHQPQIDFARNAIDFGADLVIGAHPHWAQIFETYKGKYIFYSLGNFIFDQEWSRDTKEGLTLKITLQSRKSSAPKSGFPPQGTRVEQIELIPIVIENYSTPRPATETEAQQILKKIGAPEKIIKPNE